MATEILLPQWAMGLMDGSVTHWLKAVGDYVEAGEPLAEVEEAKVTGEVSASVAGYVLKILVQEGATAPVRSPICLIGTKEELQDQSPHESSDCTSSTTLLLRFFACQNAEHSRASVQVTPVARKLAMSNS